MARWIHTVKRRKRCKMLKDIIKVKDRVKMILQNNVQARNDDKELIIRWWQEDDNIVHDDDFLECIEKMPPFESITRARREIQKECPKLRSDKQIKRARDREEKLIAERYMRR